MIVVVVVWARYKPVFAAYKTCVPIYRVISCPECHFKEEYGK